MTRINVYTTTTDEYTNEEPTLAGWFDPTTATDFGAATRWDGNNHISVITGSQWIDEYLYRTKGGRWVLNRDASRYHNGPDTYEFLTDEQAKDWLLRSECNDEAIATYFGPVEEERGPGRPEIGPAVNVRLDQAMLDEIDGQAKANGLSRAAMIRKLLDEALVSRPRI